MTKAQSAPEPAASGLNYVDWFRSSSPYINAHRGKTFVLMFGGDAIEDPNFGHIIHDIALLNTLGVRLVLVHGSRPQIEERIALRRLESRFHRGLRITDPGALECVMDASGSLRAHLEALLSMGLPDSPMHRADIRMAGGNFVIAKPLGVLDGIDHQHTGEVRRIQVEAIRGQLGLGNIVLISPIGYSPTGEIFNLATEEVAIRVAAGLKAEKLIAFDRAEGLLDADGRLIRELRLGEARQLLDAPGEDRPERLLQLLFRHNGAGVERCHIITYRKNGALLQELFTRDGCGSLIHQDSYESVRTAGIDDVGGILALIKPLEAEGVLVRRSRELLETEISRFTVIERDGMVISCAALYPFEEESSAELACVVTHPDYRGGKRAERLLNHLEKRARAMGLSQVFVLTTRTAHWFLEQGYAPGSTADLPAARQRLYNYQRNSRIFCKTLPP